MKKEQKQCLFLGVCVPLRIMIGVTLWLLLDDTGPIKNSVTGTELEKLKDGVVGAVLVFSIISVFTIFPRITQDAWWSRIIEMVMAMVMCLLCVLYYTKRIEAKYIAILVWIDVVWGLTQFAVCRRYGNCMGI